MIIIGYKNRFNGLFMERAQAIKELIVLSFGNL